MEDTRAGYEELMALMLARRSIREFDDRDVEQEKIDRILTAASTAPMGIPPSDVEVLVVDGKDKVREFADDMLELMKRNGYFQSLHFSYCGLSSRWKSMKSLTNS